MRRWAFVVAAVLAANSALAQTNIGEVSLSQLGDDNDVDAVCTGTVTANAGSGTFVVGDGAGALNTIVDSGTLTCNAGSGTFVVGDGSGALNVIVDSSALPSGAATSALQDGIVKDGTGDTTQANVASGRLSVDGSGVTQPISAAALPLPSGAATSALQDGIVKDGTGDTTQANVSSGRLNVDGSGVTQPVSGTVTVGTFPDNEPFNIAQVAGATAQSGSGTATGALRVELPTNGTGVLATVGTVTTVTNLTNLPNEGQQTAANSISVTPDTDNDAIGATGAAPPGEVIDVGGRTSGADTTGLMTGLTICTEHVAVDIVTATTTLVITGVSARHVRICAINLVTTGAQAVALIAGTGATCGTSTAGINGGVTAAEGWSFAAGGGIAQGNGIGEIMSTKVTGGATGDSVCIVNSVSTQLSGTISYAIY